ncbi:MAG TPA: TIGR03564 family F420-dependent LLM class oxidoreductase, partial [Acidimicrobiia bacterium]|nr:TIGR03564 family F420-dependent LLM class oxidoreductase [Acidimicrobiia bacterium]
MRIGLMIGPERGRYREKVPKLIADAVAAEQAGFTSIWFPQVPDDFDAMTAVALMGQATERIEIGTAVVPLQTRHPIAMAQQALATQAVCEGRFVLGVGPSHHWIITDMLGLPYERPAVLVRNYLDVLNVALRTPGPVDVENDDFRIHNPLDITDVSPTPVLLAALAPVMLRVAGELASGTILWMADERAIGEHIIPRITKAAAEAARPAPRVVAGVPVVLCSDGEIDDARAWANVALGHAEYSPNYERLLEHGDATDVGDVLAGGSEAAVVERLRSFRDAGVTDLGVRPLPLGKSRDERIESRRRVLDFVASLTPEL